MYNNIGLPDAEKDILDRIAEAQNAAGEPEVDTGNERAVPKTSIVVTDATPPTLQNEFSDPEQKKRPVSWSASSNHSVRGRSRSRMLGIVHNGVPLGAQRVVPSSPSRSRSRGSDGVSVGTGYYSMPSSPRSAGSSIDLARKSLSQTVYERQLLTLLSEKDILLEGCRETCNDLKRQLEESEESHKALLDEIEEQKQASGYNDHSFESLLENYKGYNLANDLETTKNTLSETKNIVTAQEDRIGELEALLKESNADLENHRASRNRSISTAVSRHHGRSSSAASSRVHQKTSSLESVDPSLLETLRDGLDGASSTLTTPDMSRGRSPLSPEVKGASDGVRLLKDLLAKTLLMRCRLALAASKIPLAEKLVRRSAAAAMESRNLTLHGEIAIWRREIQEQMQVYQSPNMNQDTSGSQASIYDETEDFDDSPQFDTIDLVPRHDTPTSQQNRTFGNTHGYSNSFGSSRSSGKNKPAPLLGLGLGIDFGPGSKPELTSIRESPTGSPTPRATQFSQNRKPDDHDILPFIDEDATAPHSDEDEALRWSSFVPAVNTTTHMPRLGDEEAIAEAQSSNPMPAGDLPSLDLASSPPNDSPDFEAYHSSNAIMNWQSQISEAVGSSGASVQSTPDMSTPNMSTPDMSAPGEDYESEPEDTPLTPADGDDKADEVKKAKALWG